MTRAAILIYGLVSAAFYSALLPPWEGFDELYHYGYVQSLAHSGAFPAVGQARLSRELWTSLDYLPVSHFIQPYLQRPSTNFQEYFRFSDQERRARRHSLDTIDGALQREMSPRDNYEAKQAPLTYLLLAPFDRMFSTASLPAHVLWLRLLLSLTTMVLLWIGALRLARRLGLEGAMLGACLFVIFSCQMLYGATCHVANDALTIPWVLFFVTEVIDACASPTAGRTAAAASLMAVGLLIKASLLVFVPLVFAARMPHRRRVVAAAILIVIAGPWYLRNIRLYHNFTATVDTSTGVGAKELLHAAFALPWGASIVSTAHASLWTGNNSFTSFSASTLNAVLGMLAVAAVLYGLRFRRSIPEVVTVAAIALYCAGLVIITLTFFHATGGLIIGPMPWYVPAVFVPGVMLCFLGLSRWQRSGRWVAEATVLLWAYVAAASWCAKLVPLYGGFEDPHARPRQLLTWYMHNSAQRDSILANLSPAGLAPLYVLFVAVLAALIIACARILTALWKNAPAL